MGTRGQPWRLGGSRPLLGGSLARTVTDNGTTRSGGPGRGSPAGPAWDGGGWERAAAGSAARAAAPAKWSASSGRSLTATADDDLPPEVEQRRSARYDAGVQPLCRVLGPAGAGPAEAGIRDILTTGISIPLEQRFEPGAVVLVELHHTERRFTRRVPARIIHAIEWPNGDWLHGCEFLRELSADELHALL